jgi:hypothetical protein
MQIDPSRKTAFRRFAEAIHAFSNVPDEENFRRYLAASRALDASQPRPIVAPARHARALR